MQAIYLASNSGDRLQFQSIASVCSDLSHFRIFSDVEEALEWACKHTVDIVFIDTELKNTDVLKAASCFISPQRGQVILPKIVFCAQDGKYALAAWQIGASGYFLKPCTKEKIRNELQKCRFQPLPSQRVVIQTIPTFSVTANGAPLHMSAAKPRELFALLVDHGERGLSSAEGIAYLWPEKDNDKKTQALFRMTYKRLLTLLEEAGIADIISSKDSKRFLMVDKVNCDLYHILAGDDRTQKKYAGQYLQEYSWAEERNAQLYHMLMS